MGQNVLGQMARYDNTATTGHRLQGCRQESEKGVTGIWCVKCAKNFLQVNYIHCGRGQLTRFIHFQCDVQNAKKGTSGSKTSNKTKIYRRLEW